jgi:hypothetical protein
MFDELLMKKAPGITKEELDYFRQALAGEFNKGKAVVVNNEQLPTGDVK